MSADDVSELIESLNEWFARSLWSRQILWPTPPASCHALLSIAATKVADAPAAAHPGLNAA